jgi:hypothetical protein
MATSTFGTTANSSLTALIASGASAATPALSAADIAQIVNLIKDDLNVAHPRMPTAWAQGNLLYVPNRGILKVLPGDWVAVDSQGWPILVSANSVALSSWVHVP